MNSILTRTKSFIRRVIRKMHLPFRRHLQPKDFVKMALDKRNFDLWESLGFHVIPSHFHYPVPDTRNLRDDIWEKTSPLIGLDINVERQLKFLSDIIPVFIEECDFLSEPSESRCQFSRRNGAFLSVDAEVFHCMIRHFRPRRIIEVGSGSTTYLAARACLLNKEKNNLTTELHAIDPFPNEVVKKGFPGLTSLIQKPVEWIAVDFFSQLEANDIFFIDSSHVAGIGSDVNYEFLEIIPRLKPGVIIHVHDIFLPAEYPRKWIFEDRFFWTEQYILQAFLSFNPAFEVLWGSSFMHRNYPGELRKAFPAYQNLENDYPFYPDIWPSSFWFRRASK